MFERRKREVRLAEAPRAGAMDQPEDPGEAEGVLENGRRKPSAQEIEAGNDAQGSDAIQEEEEAEDLSESKPTFEDAAKHHLDNTDKPRLSRDRGESDTTAVASDNEFDAQDKHKADGGFGASKRLESAGAAVGEGKSKTEHMMDTQPAHFTNGSVQVG